MGGIGGGVTALSLRAFLTVCFSDGSSIGTDVRNSVGVGGCTGEGPADVDRFPAPKSLSSRFNAEKDRARPRVFGVFKLSHNDHQYCSVNYEREDRKAYLLLSVNGADGEGV